MKEDQIPVFVRFRMSQAHETLHEAEVLYGDSSWRGSVNRSYYAMFYALAALLATRRLGSSKHSGVLALFQQEFVKTGVFSPELGRAFRLAFDRRQKSDYGDNMAPDREAASEALSSARVFVSALEQHLVASGFLGKTM
ncbi:MAG: HEPN domain-containing protein [Candidatus Sumerlaeota bacterium]|nr:HEPN domain-containing protein [Candidatus Sumerlaeota bacterium]